MCFAVSRWLVARNADGQYGKIPENYLQNLDEEEGVEVWRRHAVLLHQGNGTLTCCVCVMVLCVQDDGDDDGSVSPGAVAGPDGELDENAEYDMLKKITLPPPQTRACKE